MSRTFIKILSFGPECAAKCPAPVRYSDCSTKPPGVQCAPVLDKNARFDDNKKNQKRICSAGRGYASAPGRPEGGQIMRVIAGEARGRRLEALPGTDVTRPTLSQVKEAMFSIVQFDLPGARVLDLYAGSGQLGIEALSRGAARCVFLDENREAVNIVMRNCKTCGVFDRSRVNVGEAARYLSACREQFDVVLLDSPFRGGTLEKILPAVDKCTAPGGTVLCESETGLVLPAQVGGLTLQKQYKYGKVLLWKYTKLKEYVKGQRKLFKDYIGRLNDKIFLKDDEGIFADMQGAGIQIRTLLKVAKVYAKRVSEVKREKGIIDFNDMEHLALSILVKKEDGKLVYTETADKLANRFEEILIDEYQDSNQLQEVILNAVSKTRLSGENNNIYMVGDVKQSIYKFRLACPELFIEKYDTYGETGDNVRIELQKNFRSRENVLECANDVFSHIMNKNFSGIGYDESVRLNAGFPYPEYSDSNYGDGANKSTDVILISSENEEEATTRELEADRLAKLIEGIVASGVNVYDADKNIYRPAEYRDIVILTRSVTGWADTFADALMDRGIPAYTDSSTGYFSVREIQVILCMLTIVDNPVQEISLAAAMMSYFGGFTAAELGMVRKLGREYVDKNVHNNLYEHLKAVAVLGGEDKIQETDVKQLSGKCALFLAKLTQYRDKSSVEPLYDLCWEMIYDSGYYDYVGTMPAGAQRQANLNVLLERAAGYGKSSYSGLFNFLRYIERLKKFDEDFAEGAASLDNENLVRIMSIHKSKGLEFPIVILAGAHKSINFMDATAPVLVDQNLGIAVDYVDLKRRTKTPTIIKGAMARRIVRESIAEEERLLYVAMTRAREKLIITGVVKDADKTLDKYRGRAEQLAADGMLSFADSENIKNYLDMIMPVCLMDSDKLKGSFNVMVDAGENSESDAFESEEMSDENKKAVADKDLMSQPEVSAGYPLLDELPEYVPDDNAAGRMKLTVSQLKAMQAEDDSEENAYMDESVKAAIKMEAYDETNSIIPKFISGKEVKLAANERGSAYHRVMECLDYSVSVNIEGVKADINRMLETGKMNELQVKSVNPWDINTFVQSDTGRRVANAVNCGSVRREQPFVFEYEGQLIQGIIDLCFEEDGELVIVDYKTDRVMKGKAGEKELVKRYAIQLDYYAKALEQLTGKTVKEKIVYSFALGKEIMC